MDLDLDMDVFSQFVAFLLFNRNGNEIVRIIRIVLLMPESSDVLHFGPTSIIYMYNNCCNTIMHVCLYFVACSENQDKINTAVAYSS